MRKTLLLLLLFCFQFSYAQKIDQEISLNFTNKELPEILKEMESITNFKFFFEEDWFGLNKYSGEYSNEKLTIVLEDILKETNINYYIKGERIIITRGSLIYDRLPKGFLEIQEEREIVQENQSADPVFYNENEEQAEVVETVLIGKENRQSNRSTYRLSGRVVSEKGDPISGLNILIPNQNKGTVTDINGNFEIRLSKGINILETQALGVDKVKKRLIVYNDGVLNLQLKESFEELSEVLVEANARDNVRTALTGVEKINVAEIKNIPLVLGERDILKVATTLPGITTAGEAASGYNVT